MNENDLKPAQRKVTQISEGPSTRHSVSAAESVPPARHHAHGKHQGRHKTYTIREIGHQVLDGQTAGLQLVVQPIG